MANWNGHFILTVFGDFYPALNGDFRPPLTEVCIDINVYRKNHENA